MICDTDISPSHEAQPVSSVALGLRFPEREKTNFLTAGDNNIELLKLIITIHIWPGVQQASETWSEKKH